MVFLISLSYGWEIFFYTIRTLASAIKVAAQAGFFIADPYKKILGWLESMERLQNG
jgi:hypothetical protein